MTPSSEEDAPLFVEISRLERERAREREKERERENGCDTRHKGSR